MKIEGKQMGRYSTARKALDSHPLFLKAFQRQQDEKAAEEKKAEEEEEEEKADQEKKATQQKKAAQQDNSGEA